jgi:uncharacterized protein involved in exopolysaccharide biosynthesis
LIEEPDVPRDLVRSTITSYADQRLQVITQRVMTTRNLIGIIDKYQLYVEARAREPINILVEILREDTDLELVSADVIDPRSGRPTQATIAFTLSFDHRRPQTAQRVVNELVSLYLGENLRTRREKAAETTGFLTNETAKMNQLVDKLEAELTGFKLRHAGSLPEQFEVNLQLMDRSERDLLEVKRQIQALEERRIFLNAELAQLSPYGSYEIDGERIISPEEQLKAMKTKIISLQGIYGPEHPDVVKLNREIKALEKATGAGPGTAELERQLEELRSDLARAREKYADDHPDVAKLIRQQSSLQGALQEVQRQPPVKRTAPPDNPAYIQLQAQLEAIRFDLRALRDHSASLQERLQAFEARVLGAPQVEREYLLLQRDYNNAVASYQEVKAKQTEAELGEALETESKSERFSLIEPPTLPIEPVKPNRLAILLLGFIFSLAAGVGGVALSETMDQAVYGPQQVAIIAGAPPLVVVPYIKNRADVMRAQSRAAAWFLGVACGVGAALYLVHEVVLPLDVLWSIIARHLEGVLGGIDRV